MQRSRPHVTRRAAHLTPQGRPSWARPRTTPLSTDPGLPSAPLDDVSSGNTWNASHVWTALRNVRGAQRFPQRMRARLAMAWLHSCVRSLSGPEPAAMLMHGGQQAGAGLSSGNAAVNRDCLSCKQHATSRSGTLLPRCGGVRCQPSTLNMTLGLACTWLGIDSQPDRPTDRQGCWARRRRHTKGVRCDLWPELDLHPGSIGPVGWDETLRPMS